MPTLPARARISGVRLGPEPVRTGRGPDSGALLRQGIRSGVCTVSDTPVSLCLLYPEKGTPMSYSDHYPEELRQAAQYREGVDAGRKSRDDRPADSHAGNGYEGEDRGVLDAWVCGYIDGWNERDSELRVARLTDEEIVGAVRGAQDQFRAAAERAFAKKVGR